MSEQAKEIDQAVGGNIRRIRMLLGLSQEKTGAVLGVTFQQVQKYEKGSNRISPGRLVILARYFDVPLLEFFKGVELPDADHAVPIVNKTHAQLTEAFDAISNKAVRSAAVDAVRAMGGH